MVITVVITVVITMSVVIAVHLDNATYPPVNSSSKMENTSSSCTITNMLFDGGQEDLVGSGLGPPTPAPAFHTLAQSAGINEKIITQHETQVLRLLFQLKTPVFQNVSPLNVNSFLESLSLNKSKDT